MIFLSILKTKDQTKNLAIKVTTDIAANLIIFSIIIFYIPSSFSLNLNKTFKVKGENLK